MAFVYYRRGIVLKHIIYDISFSRDWIQCVCGYEGKAYDLKAFHAHKKDTPEFNSELTFVPKFEGTFIRRRRVAGVLEEVY